MKASIGRIGDVTMSQWELVKRRAGIAAPICLAIFFSGVAGSVSAFTFSPPRTAFTLDSFADGHIRGVRPKNWSCGLAMTARVNKDGSKANIETFFSSNCPLTAPNLPWKVEPESASTAVIKDFSYVFEGHTCGPSNVQVTVSSKGVWTFNSKHDGCEVEYLSETVPSITIVP